MRKKAIRMWPNDAVQRIQHVQCVRSFVHSMLHRYHILCTEYKHTHSNSRIVLYIVRSCKNNRDDPAGVKVFHIDNDDNSGGWTT